MKTITFLLDRVIVSPGGGVKIILEHANRLVAAGHNVNIVYPATINWKKSPLLYKLKSVYHYFLHEKRGFSCRRWFDLDPRVNELHPWTPGFGSMPKSDIYIATEVRTAPYVAAYPIDKSRKYYFIQGFENWNVSDEFVYDTYRLPLNKIVISQWLMNILCDKGLNAAMAPNGFDGNYFRLEKPIHGRNPYSIGMLYHTHKFKNVALGVRALKIVMEKYPHLKISFFGIPERPMDLDIDFNYYQSPSQQEHVDIYNNIAIFVGSSDTEGWGLTIGEAMMCGAAVACTDNNGYLEMAHHMDNALVSPVGDAETLAANILKLIEDDQLRERLAAAGVETIKNFSWERSSTAMQKALGLA